MLGRLDVPVPGVPDSPSANEAAASKTAEPEAAAAAQGAAEKKAVAAGAAAASKPASTPEEPKTQQGLNITQPATTHGSTSLATKTQNVPVPGVPDSPSANEAAAPKAAEPGRRARSGTEIRSVGSPERDQTSLQSKQPDWAYPRSLGGWS
jgi:hypothetical protein